MLSFKAYGKFNRKNCWPEESVGYETLRKDPLPDTDAPRLVQVCVSADAWT